MRARGISTAPICAPAKTTRDFACSSCFNQLICGQSYSPFSSRERDTLKSPACTHNRPFFVSATIAMACSPSDFARQRPRKRLESRFI